MAVQTFSSVVGLNVGGRIFTTRLTTLCKYPDSMLGVMFSGRHSVDQDKDGNYFIDRNGKYFEHILDFLRDEHYLPPAELFEFLVKEAEYFSIIELAERLKNVSPLYPGIDLMEQSRNAVNNYCNIRNDVMKLAKTNVITNGSKCSEFNTTVYLIIYSTNAVDKHIRFRNSDSFDAMLHNSIGTEGSKSTICLSKENVNDFELFKRILLHDLRQFGYRVEGHLSELNHQEYFQNMLYNLKKYLELPFLWSLF